MVVYKLVTWLVENGCGVGLCNSETNSVTKSLSERTSRNLNARCVMGLWMAWCYAVDALAQVSMTKIA